MSSSALTSRQREELHRAILDYLSSCGYSQSLDALKVEAGQEDFQADPKAKWAGLLEKKWTSVIRLQKKIMDLETRNAQLLEEVSLSRTAPSSTRNSADWVPRAPAKHTLTGHRAPITCVAFHPVFSNLCSASEDSSMKIWDWESGDFERTLKGHTKPVQDCEYDSKGNLLVSCSSDLTLKLWDTNNDYKNTKTLYGHDHSVSSARFLHNDEQIVSASRDKSIRIWEVATGFCIRTLTGHDEWVRSALPSFEGRWLVSCSNDQSARVWDAASGDIKADLRGHEHVIEVAIFAPPVSHAALRELGGLVSPAGLEKQPSNGFVATGSRDKAIRIWDGQNGQCLRTLIGHDNWIRGLAFHPNGKTLLSSSDDKTVRMWDLKTGRCVKTLDAHEHFVSCISWGRQTQAQPAPNGDAALTNGASTTPNAKLINVLATGSVDQTIRIWLP
ncbi:uncharacterized protein L969DRAFT_46298 [Mixia osmundae IAM 14324]|uniref:uncharacterized protein n=1 Tax=Mixia osmundae (strain CBS 9802 / IAM 14324 / JCM 22182 / KY 12970) TaxID=764103 RepID=UPI0004A549F1|nr:uncharacterized protein L969DRAFT_46298 [Mixia osmundae IAM 14324]KEI40903.1 hypothetical protein L969DRAFT_46298 [Mixia osmundae IAM 14324]